MTEIKKCPYLKKCGACQTIGQNYEDVLEKKRVRLDDMLRPVIRVPEIEGMQDPYHYRNKVHRAFACVYDGKHVRHEAGIYAEGTHKVVPVEQCLIENEKADEIIRDIVRIARKYKMRIYDEDTGEGLLRHVLVRTAHSTGQVMVVLVLSSPVMPGKKNFVSLIRKKHPEIASIIINVNKEKTSMVLGEKESNAYGRGFIVDTLCGRKFRISSRSFYQVNSLQTEKLYRTAIKWANLTGRETVIDAYCGIGTIGICAADHAKEVVGCELNPEAVKDASENAKLNQLKNIRFVNADAGDFLGSLSAQHKKADVIFLDPPRTGSSEEFLSAAAAASPGRIIYISCGPRSLLRDLKQLEKLGYKARKAKAFDMFPFTEHVETLVLLTKK